MHRTTHGLNLALKLIGAAAALTVIALGLASSTIFGDANSFGVAMFLGFAFFIPAACLCVLGLLALATRPPHSDEAVGANYLQPNQVSGVCPNCEAMIPLMAAACPCCGALFGDHSAWQVRKHPQVRR